MRKILTSFLIAFSLASAVSAKADDQYVTGGSVDVEKKVNGDFVAAGGTVNVFADVSGDVIVAGGTVLINGNVAHHVRVAGGTVTINGNVGEDVLAYGGTVYINRNSNVSGDLIVGAGAVSIDGSVKGDVRAEAGAMVVRGWIQGNAEISASDYLQFTSNAQVSGNLKYFSDSPAIIPDGVVKGQTIRTPSLFGRTDLIIAKLIMAGWMYFSILLLGFILCLLLPGEMRNIAEDMREDFWKNMGIGFVVLVVGAATAVIAAITIVGLPLAFIISGGFAIAWLITQISVGLFFANLFFKNQAGSKWRLFGRLSFGLLLYQIVGLIPIFGGIFAFLLTLLAFGTFARRRYEMMHFLKAKKYW